MPPAIQSCVIDSSVLVDLKAGGLLHALVGLEHYIVMTTDFVLDELQDAEIHQLQERGLVKCESEADRIEALFDLKLSYRGPSISDLSTIVLARATDALLLTSDKHLRNAATREGIEVHGTLWLLDEMVKYHVITPPVASEALSQMLRNKSRLPKSECAKRLARWQRLDPTIQDDEQENP